MGWERCPADACQGIRERLRASVGPSLCRRAEFGLNPVPKPLLPTLFVSLTPATQEKPNLGGPRFIGSPRFLAQGQGESEHKRAKRGCHRGRYVPRRKTWAVHEHQVFSHCWFRTDGGCSPERARRGRPPPHPRPVGAMAGTKQGGSCVWGRLAWRPSGARVGARRPAGDTEAVVQVGATGGVAGTGSECGVWGSQRRLGVPVWPGGGVYCPQVGDGRRRRRAPGRGGRASQLTCPFPRRSPRLGPGWCQRVGGAH